ncbi:ATPase [Planomonospora parontospora subsp. parontospora]|uniref:histidine kinase n=3 Tax=Planomonospora parontospora TaxID=58119 RepID=A0AA37BEN3_9ACTN|nr:histidine kinase [Planomonospora parontospora]GGK60857.1 ATPase [Planomonospora parontospora]GII08727.1 ATPase [Planomonospora parontospora subsp. parontospora]
MTERLIDVMGTPGAPRAGMRSAAGGARLVGAAARGLRLVGAVAAGAVTALAGLLFVLVATPFADRPAVRSAAARLTGLELRRLRLELPGRDAEGELRYLAARTPVGLLGGIVVLLLVIGVGLAVTLASSWGRGEAFDGMLPTPPLVAYIGLSGFVLLFLDVCGLVGVEALERRLAVRLLAPDPTEALRRRIDELTVSRAGVVAAVDAERRRIERDLHDGVQQRLVALSMLAGRARRGRPELLGQLHEQAQQALVELREVAWRVYPSGLDAHGLAEALAGVAERASVAVKVTCELPERPPAAVEAAAYFVAGEAVTNAVKHSGATLVAIEVRQEGAAVVVRVEDDGTGGADAAGGGLTGLAQRVAALDGRFTVTSPPGGPTVIEAELPCASRPSAA